MSIRLVFLGAAQDGGVPQMNCACGNCSSFELNAASVAIVDGEKAVLIDATPDLRRQNHLLKSNYNAEITAVCLTHAHWGHYGGLPLFGPESMNVQGLPLYATERMHTFLQANEPFASLFSNGNLIGQTSLSVEKDKHRLYPVVVPHRDEFSDTVAYVIDLNGRSALYMPDVDELTPEVEILIRSCDLAIIDGTFYAEGESEARDISVIKHPRVKDTCERLKDIADHIIFTHLNHTNPLLDPASAERMLIEEMGFRVAQDGMELD